MPVRAFLDSDSSNLRPGSRRPSVSMPVRAFLDSDGTRNVETRGLLFGFNARQGISWFRRCSFIYDQDIAFRVSMPVRAFLDSDSSFTPLNWSRKCVSMPVRAFLDSDTYWWNARNAYAWGEVSMPVRAFLDSDGIEPDLLPPKCIICFNARQGISWFRLSCPAVTGCNCIWVSMPVRAFLDSDQEGINIFEETIWSVSMPVRAFLDSD